MSDDNVKKIRFSGNLSFSSENPNSSVIVSDSSGKAIDQPNPKNIEADKEKEKYNKAYQDGWKACETKLNPSINNLKKELQETSAALPSAISAYFSELESQAKKEIISLSFEIAKIILNEEIKNKEILKGVLEEAMTPLTNTSGIKIYLNPSVAADAASVTDIAPGAEIIADPKLKPGEAMLESSQGIIDASLSGRLETLKDAYLKILSEQKD